MAGETQVSYADAGMPGWQTERFASDEVFAGEVPPRWTSNELLDSSMVATADFPAFSVVGRNAAGNLVLADPSLGTPVLPIGITTAPVSKGAVNLTVAIFRAGSFNLSRMNWSAYYSTDVLKRRAFEWGYPGAAFCMKKPDYQGVYA